MNSIDFKLFACKNTDEDESNKIKKHFILYYKLINNSLIINIICLHLLFVFDNST